MGEKPKNYIAVEMRIDGRKFYGIKTLPESELKLDKEIGDIGYEIAKAMEVFSLKVTEQYNILIKELEDERRKTIG